MRITQGWIEKATEGNTEGRLVWDDQVPFLGLRIGKRKKVWIVRVRDRTSDTKIILGDALSISPQDARMKAIKEVDIRRGKPSLLFGDWSARWMVSHPMAPLTRRDYTRHMDILNEYFGKKKLRDITRVEIGFVRDEETKKHGQVQANRILACLSSCLGDAMEVDALDFNPCIGVHRHPTQARERRLTPQELTRLLDAIPKVANPCYRACYLTILLTACRPGEAQKMRWEDVDLEAREWCLKTTKNKRPHTIPLSDMLVEILRSLPQINEWVFSGIKKGQHINGFPKMWPALVRSAGIKDLHMHDLRRSAASLLLDKGKDLKFIGALLNHQNQATTEVYARAGGRSKREGVDLLEQAIKDAKSPSASTDQGPQHDIGRASLVESA